MADVGTVVVGAGVVGLAIAARLARQDAGLVVVEKNERHGQETSSRNSEVIHAGIYYAEGSLKALLCVRGNHLLYDYCARREVPHRRTGKLITAVEAAELEALETLLARGTANGVALELIDAEAASALEPHVRTVGALLSPTSGIVSAHGLMDALLHDAREAGALLQTKAELLGLERSGGEYRVTLATPAGEESFFTERVINAAGLEADTIAALAGIDVDAAGYRLHYWKGSYFSVSPAKAGLVSRLVYPVPNPVSLGVHAVLGIDGRLRFGPDAEHLPDRRLDYAVDEAKRTRFAESVRRLVPELGEADLAPDIAGIRPKLQAPGEGVRDFVIEEESGRGLPGLVNILGTDSPGLTAALAIAEEVESLLR